MGLLVLSPKCLLTVPDVRNEYFDSIYSFWALPAYSTYVAWKQVEDFFNQERIVNFVEC
jgi:hypothetical protein